MMLADSSPAAYISAIAACVATAAAVATYFLSRSSRNAAREAAKVAQNVARADAQDAANRIITKTNGSGMRFGPPWPHVTVDNQSDGDVTRLAVTFKGHAPATRAKLLRGETWDARPPESTFERKVAFDEWTLSFTDRFGHRWTRGSDHEGGPAVWQS